MGIRIAIDGPASSGKGTVARRVARALGYAYVDTGAMYRAVGLSALNAGIPLSNEARLATLARALRFHFSWTVDGLRVQVDDQDISEAVRSEEAGQAASAVAVLGEVRAALLDLQQRLGDGGAVVMDGRDIGTVILPNAELKVFLDASVDVRAQRRHAEIQKRGAATTFTQVRAELVARDAQDSGRAVAPLCQATDAVRLDSTKLTPDEVVARVLALAVERGAVVTS
jgi:CMP/dCMP kinase